MNVETFGLLEKNPPLPSSLIVSERSFTVELIVTRGIVADCQYTTHELIITDFSLLLNLYS